MSDMSHSTVAQRRKRIDIVDEAWLKDTLSDDEIELTKDTFQAEDEDEDEDDQIAFVASGEDTWAETGLDIFSSEVHTPFTKVFPPPLPTSGTPVITASGSNTSTSTASSATVRSPA